MIKKNKLIYFLTEDWFFCSHYIDRARKARDSGFCIAVVARGGKHIKAIQREGFEIFPISLNRHSLNPIRELYLLMQIVRVYLKFGPDIVHHVGIKPICYGTIAALLVKVKFIVNAPIGLGYVFSSDSWLAYLLRPLIKLIYKFTINPENSRVIFENVDDLNMFVKNGHVRRGDSILISGAGVCLKTYHPTSAHREIPVVILTSRMLIDKGVHEFVAAAKLLHSRGIKARFILAGAPDMKNPSSINEETLVKWGREGFVEYLGWQDKLSEVLQNIDIVCLPSYREGLPKSLIEACACGLPIVTTDTIGCRDVVINGVNGFLVPVKSVELLADALELLIVDPQLRSSMGKASRKRAEYLFDTNIISSKTLQVYKDLLNIDIR